MVLKPCVHVASLANAVPQAATNKVRRIDRTLDSYISITYWPSSLDIVSGNFHDFVPVTLLQIMSLWKLLQAIKKGLNAP